VNPFVIVVYINRVRVVDHEPFVDKQYDLFIFIFLAHLSKGHVKFHHYVGEVKSNFPSTTFKICL